ncbi:4-hydroxy-3-methylbut-2-enyl diphosphate reductase [bacterium SCSIO 12741]|nr:4-hydroxy-3-methylbut-2-enyl diphosphate reductase [bacterium SCSIO 12741]
MKKFDIPTHYRSSFIGQIKQARKAGDPRKKDFSPTVLDFGPLRFLIARHFGFCYGVENAIEISYRTVHENQGKRVFLLSQMIHNPLVNRDLEEKGIQFIMDTEGNQFIPWEELTNEDVVIVPAFGTTVEIEERLRKIGIQMERYDTTCPFVKKVWTMSAKLGKAGATVIIHGKHQHEETRATFSHSRENAPSVVVRDIEEARKLAAYMTGEKDAESFYQEFAGKHSQGFDPKIHFNRVGVVNQTTMLASETQEIAEYMKTVMVEKFGEDQIKEHYQDTRDTLCYATNDNQDATYGLLQEDADLAIVVGGYNSSNTSHLVELCEQKFPTYFIDSVDRISESQEIDHFHYETKTNQKSSQFLPEKDPVTLVLTSGASCPDSAIDAVMDKLLSFYPEARSKEEVLQEILDQA